MYSEAVGHGTGEDRWYRGGRAGRYYGEDDGDDSHPNPHHNVNQYVPDNIQSVLLENEHVQVLSSSVSFK